MAAPAVPEWPGADRAWIGAIGSAAVAGPVDNVSAWGDFKEWMDEAFSRAVRAGSDAVHAANPSALAAIEGAQIPGWGGYDYSRLVHAVDVMEIYDFGNNVEIARDMNPALIRLSTMSAADPGAAASVWRQVLLGGGDQEVLQMLIDRHGP